MTIADSLLDELYAVVGSFAIHLRTRDVARAADALRGVADAVRRTVREGVLPPRVSPVALLPDGPLVRLDDLPTDPLTRRRVASHGDGWNPFPAPAWLAKTARTIPLEGLDDLAPMLDHLWTQVDAAGRARDEIDVAFTTGLPGPADPAFDAAAGLCAVKRLFPAPR